MRYSRSLIKRSGGRCRKASGSSATPITTGLPEKLNSARWPSTRRVRSGRRLRPSYSAPWTPAKGGSYICRWPRKKISQLSLSARAMRGACESVLRPLPASETPRFIQLVREVRVDIQAETIVALCTPPGRSAIGVIRLSGSDSLKILKELIASSPSFTPQPNLLTLRSLFDPFTGAVLDRALVCFFEAPHSFTGEDVVELHCHGSPVLLQSIVDIILKLDARLADRGEFSLR